MFSASTTSSGVPGLSPAGRPASNSPPTSTGIGATAVGTITGCPSPSISVSRNRCFLFPSSHGTSILIASADGVGAGPVTDQPPPRTYSFPLTACAESASSIVSRMSSCSGVRRPWILDVDDAGARGRRRLDTLDQRTGVRGHFHLAGRRGLGSRLVEPRATRLGSTFGLEALELHCRVVDVAHGLRDRRMVLLDQAVHRLADAAIAG